MELPLLQRREIEARVLAPVIEALAAKFGHDEVLALLSETIKRVARDHGAEIAQSMGGNTMADMAKVLDFWRTWQRFSTSGNRTAHSRRR